jgi:formiminotetrahydrofolate cyclodeaminase
MSESDLTLTRFLEDLASASPAPGGGAVAALAGALGAALVGMVSRLTVGRKNYQAVEAEFRAIESRADALRAELVKLMDADAEAYRGVMAAYQQPKATARESQVRNDAIELALKRAAEIPLRVAVLCSQVLQMCETAAKRGNQNAASDAGAAALLAEAGLLTAILNVETNVALIHDMTFVNTMRAELVPLKQVTAARPAIRDSVRNRL